MKKQKRKNHKHNWQLNTGEFLSPNMDWRTIAEARRNYPLCKNCGKPFGNVYFGASHYCEKGYSPLIPLKRSGNQLKK